MQRKLTVILSADVVGYSSHMERDAAGTLSRLTQNRQTLFDPRVATQGGRVFKVMGDGVLCRVFQRRRRHHLRVRGPAGNACRRSQARRRRAASLSHRHQSGCKDPRSRAGRWYSAAQLVRLAPHRGPAFKCWVKPRVRKGGAILPLGGACPAHGEGTGAIASPCLLQSSTR